MSTKWRSRRDTSERSASCRKSGLKSGCRRSFVRLVSTSMRETSPVHVVTTSRLAGSTKCTVDTGLLKRKIASPMELCVGGHISLQKPELYDPARETRRL